MKCLLIETKDKRKFLTHEKNFIQLLEFSKTFNANISIVKIEEEEKVLELEELAPAICDPGYKKPKIQYEILETKLRNKRSRNDILKVATKVKEFICNQFQINKSISLKELRIKFKKYNLSTAALCNHIRRVKEILEKEGHSFEKINAGKYKLLG